MSLVDKFDTRDFVNGRLIGGNYNEMTGNTTYSDISPYGGNRMAGSGLGLGNDVVAYMGNAGMGGPRDEGIDDFIGRAVTGVINDLLLRPEDKAELRTLEYRPERDKAELRTLEYRPERDGPFELEQLVRGEGGVPGEPYDSKRTPPPEKPYGEGRDRDGFPLKLATSFDITPGFGDARRSRKGLTEDDVNRLMRAYPNDADKIRRMYLPGPEQPGFLKGV